jgi:phosphatidylserine decarboxylase
MTESHWPIAKEGIPFLILPLLVAILAFGMGWWTLASLAVLAALFIAFFFRNPRRNIPAQHNAILSPADGKIIHVGDCAEDRFLKQNALKVSIFMSIFDVHINRAPVAGRVLEKNYHPGRFLVASREKSSLLNEQNALILETEDRFKILLVQIAGFIARRIVCYADTGDTVKQGEIFGLIRFGSRVDLYLPPEVKPLVSAGQHVKGGESIIGVRS